MLQEDQPDITIERYLSKKMTAEEQRVFEGRLKTEKPLKDALELRLEAKLATLASGHDAFKASLNKRFDEKKIEKPGTFRRLWIPAVAAGLLLLCVGAFVIWKIGFRSDQSDHFKELYAEYYQPLSLTGIRSDPGSEESAYWKKIYDAYESGKYAEAEIHLKDMIMKVSDVDRSKVNLYLGICELSQQQPSSALMHLRQVDRESYHSEYAEWYLGLAHLLDNQKDSTRFYLNKIVNTRKHPQKENAIDFLKKLQ